MIKLIARYLFLTFLGAALFTAASQAEDELKLPNLGESSTSLFSPQQEYQLGRTW